MLNLKKLNLVSIDDFKCIFLPLNVFAIVEISTVLTYEQFNPIINLKCKSLREEE